jgi:hypothetical protein
LESGKKYKYLGLTENLTSRFGVNVVRSIVVFFSVMTIAALFFAGCSDMGSDVTGSSQVTPPPPSSQDVSFKNQIRPVFDRYGCTSCHGGSGGLFLQTVSQLLHGGDHGPAVVAGKADLSNLALKISPTPPFLDRMPQGGPYLPDSTIQMIRLWVNQGANDN